jgi:hypothetical protein
MNKLTWGRHLSSFLISGLLITIVGCSDGGLDKSEPEPVVEPPVIDTGDGGLEPPEIEIPIEEIPIVIPSITTPLVNITYPSICTTAGLPDSDDATNNLCVALPQGSSADISIGITDNNTDHDTPVTVTFSSTCDSAVFSKAIHNITSTAQTIASTYTSNCVGTNTVKGTVVAGEDGSPASVANTIEVATDIPSSIAYVSSVPQKLDIAGTGGVVEATVTFKLTGEQQGPVQGKIVDFTLSENAINAGVTFATGGDVSETNEAGEVITHILAGSKTTPIVISAVLRENDEITAVSNGLSVSGGPPVDGRFSLTLSHYNPNAWLMDNAKVDVTATLADRNSQPVTDGTSVIFTAESGVFITDQCQTIGGRCSVVWTSSPADHDLDIDTNTTRVTIMAEADGTEYFRDHGHTADLFDNSYTHT